jgi:RNA polymerase sigma-70 factor (ECF subfamily)
MPGSDSGTAAEITKLILQHRTVIFGYIMTQTGDYNGAEDIFQDVCVTICEKFDTFQKGTQFKAWAMQITRNKILTYYRKKGAARRTVQLTENLAEVLAGEDVWFESERPFSRELAALRRCLEKVRGKNRVMLLKRFGEGVSCKAIAGLLGWSVNSVYVALSRVRNSLGKCIEAELG